MPPYIKNTLLNFFSFFLIAFSLYIFVSLVSYDGNDSGYWVKNSLDSTIVLKFFISLFGLCSITTPNVIRAVSTLKDSKVGIYQINNFFETQEIR